MQLKKSYRFWRGLLRACTYRMQVEWQTPFTGEPAVFICNHAGALGPIDICAKFPLADHIHPWMNAQVLSAKQVPAYVRQDYWWSPESKLAPFYNATLPYIAAAILPPILRTAPTVPVYHDMRVIRTLRESIKLLQAGEHLVIFPEQPAGHRSHQMELNRGFMQIAPTYARATGKALAFWPVHIDTQRRMFSVGAPLYFDVTRKLEEQIDTLLENMRVAIHPMPSMQTDAPDAQIDLPIATPLDAVLPDIAATRE